MRRTIKQASINVLFFYSFHEISIILHFSSLQQILLLLVSRDIVRKINVYKHHTWDEHFFMSFFFMSINFGRKFSWLQENIFHEKFDNQTVIEHRKLKSTLKKIPQIILNIFLSTFPCKTLLAELGLLCKHVACTRNSSLVRSYKYFHDKFLPWSGAYYGEIKLREILHAREFL